ncbi:hypothetical protein SLEP1_g56527 [Rubroshorea leprosula]|uniref:Uncharacterized protein n=1 Tax=Rubroshorea leprosula TaxID=152421 RepID=A0AAV5MMY3_9ROSI|nr:hypothetical protein SLEP1_g56527 [Rubroshorea leprosula]
MDDLLPLVYNENIVCGMSSLSNGYNWLFLLLNREKILC